MRHRSLAAVIAASISRCYIPTAQNASSGGLTGSFSNSNRMLDHDPFFIGYLP